MIFKTAIAAAALGAMMLPGSAILLDNLAGAADLQQIRRASKPGVRVYVERRTYFGRYYPSWINADAHDAYIQHEYWRVLAESPYRPRRWYLK